MIAGKITTLAEWEADADLHKVLDGYTHEDTIENEGDFFGPHPAIARILKGEMPVEIDILDEFTDDRVACFILSVKFADETYAMAEWWAGASYPFNMQKALSKGAKALIKFVKERAPVEET